MTSSDFLITDRRRPMPSSCFLITDRRRPMTNSDSSSSTAVDR